MNSAARSLLGDSTRVPVEVAGAAGVVNHGGVPHLPGVNAVEDRDAPLGVGDPAEGRVGWPASHPLGAGGVVTRLATTAGPTASEEAAALQARSEGFNLERKAETGEMWLSVRGRGGEVDISTEAENF